MMSLDHCPAIATLYRLQFESAQGLWVLLYPEGLVKLNATAAEILRRCDGATYRSDENSHQWGNGLERPD